LRKRKYYFYRAFQRVHVQSQTQKPRAAVDEGVDEGYNVSPKTTLPFHHVILKEEDFVIGDYTTDLADKPDVRNKLGAKIF